MKRYATMTFKGSAASIIEALRAAGPGMFNGRKTDQTRIMEAHPADNSSHRISNGSGLYCSSGSTCLK